ncbi:MAG: ABC transporter permease [Acidobacteriota bacterium]|nr:ABC transporter permease [Acidobacteriota bacterium]
MSRSSVFALQFRTDLLRFWRNPQSRSFTVLLPLVFLFIFATIFKGSTIVDGRVVKDTTFYVPGIMALGIISATYVNLTISIVGQRERGELKRLRGTPVPAGFTIASRAVVGVIVAIAMAALLLVLGKVAYGVRIPGSTSVGLIIALIVGAAAFSCIAFAVSSLIGSDEAAPPATNLTILPLYFISGVFVPEHQIPALLHDIAVVFPVYHLAHALLRAFTHTHGTAISTTDLLIVAVWGVAAIVFAARRFRWTPHGD